MSFCLGLDISTSNVGWCVLQSSDRSFIEAGVIELSKLSCVFEKASKVLKQLQEIKEKYDIIDVSIEENLQSFRPGFSSAMTIMTLARFNGMISLYSRDVFGVIPRFFNVNHARKVVGLKVDKKSEVSTKDQVFLFVKNALPGFSWPTRIPKSGIMKGHVIYTDSCYDIADAYVIAMASVIE